MTEFFARLAGWFTDARRSAVQALIVSALALLTITGITSEGQSAAVADAIASVLIGVQGVLGLALLRDSERFAWFSTHIRGSIYAAAAALGPVGIAFNLWGDETSTQIVSVTTVLVSILTAFVQVLNTQTFSDAAEPVAMDDAARAAALANIAEKWGFEVKPKIADGDLASLSESQARAEWVAPLTKPEV